MDKKRVSVVDEDDDDELATILNSSNNINNSSNNYNKSIGSASNISSTAPTQNQNKSIIKYLINEFLSNNQKFAKILKDNNLIFDDPIYTDDIVLLKKRLVYYFREQQTNYQVYLDTFKEGLTEFLKKDAKLLQLCLSSVISKDLEKSGSSNNFMISSNFYFDTLIKIFLSVPVLQPIVVDILIGEIIPEYLNEDPYNFIKTICSQLRWMDSITNSESFAEHLKYLLNLFSGSIEFKKEFLGFLPDIADDETQKHLLEDLLSSLENEPQLILQIIDCLKNMNLNQSQQIEVRKHVSEKLISAEITDLPLMIDFLLLTNNSKESNQTVRWIRNGLKFSNPKNTSRDLIDSDKKQIQNASNKNKQSEVLIMDVIRSGIRFKKELWKAFLKEISIVDNPKDHKIIDIWLLILISSIGHTKDTESLFKKKILNECFTKQLLIDSIHSHDFALKSYHSQMLGFCNYFLRSNEQKVRIFGILFYQYLYKSFQEMSLRQDLIESLLQHICSNNLQEVNSGLDVLLVLCRDCLTGLKEQTTLIKSILDHINFLNENQIRKLFKIYSFLMYDLKQLPTGYQLTQNISIFNELDIFTRKQITSPFIKFKKIGIISLCSQLTRLSKRIYKTNGIGQDDGDSNSVIGRGDEVFELPVELERECSDILNNLYINCNNSQLALSYLYDELSNCYQDEPFHLTIVSLINEKFITDFQKRFVEGIVGEYNKQTVWFAVKDHETEYESVVIYPTLKDPEIKPRMLCLSSHFRLLSHLEIALSGSLQGMENLLSAPIQMFNKEVLNNENKLSDDRDKEFYSLSLFYSINYFKEILNSFSTQLKGINNSNNSNNGNNNNSNNNNSLSQQQQQNSLSPFQNNIVSSQYQQQNSANINEYKIKLIIKLKNLIKLESYFEMVLSCSPSFSIPYGTFDFDQRKSFTIDFKKIKKPTPIYQLHPIDSKEFKIPQETLIELDKPFINLIKPHFRTIDLSVFQLLIMNKQPIHHLGQYGEENSTNLDPQSLSYLLDDFYNKIVILTTQEKTGPFATMQPKSSLPYTFSEFIKKCYLVFPNLLNYLELLTKQLKSNRIKLLNNLKDSKKYYKVYQRETDDQDDDGQDEDDEDDDEKKKDKENKIKDLLSKIKNSSKSVLSLNEEQIQLQHCIHLILKCFERLFTNGDVISGNEQNNQSLFIVMNQLYEKIKSQFSSDQQPSSSSVGNGTGLLSIISLRIFSYFEKFIQPFVACKSFKLSLSLLELFVSLSQIKWSPNNRNNEELNNKIYKYSYLLLSTPWTKGDKQKVSSISLGYILKTFENYSSSPRNVLKMLIKFLYSFLEDQLLNGGKNLLTTTGGSKAARNNNNNNDDDDNNEDGDSDHIKLSQDIDEDEELQELNGNQFEEQVQNDDDDGNFGIKEIKTTLINSMNCLVFLKTIFGYLVETFGKVVNGFKDSSPSISSVISNVNFYVQCFSHLIDTYRFREKSLYLTEILKQGISFINVYSKFLTILRTLLKSNENAVSDFLNIFDRLQQGTRILHNICDHGKKQKDSLITALVPQAKKTLESLNMDIKVLLSSMNALNAFSTKKINRTNLKGISSSQEESEQENDDQNSSSSSESGQSDKEQSGQENNNDDDNEDEIENPDDERQKEKKRLSSSKNISIPNGKRLKKISQQSKKSDSSDSSDSSNSSNRDRSSSGKRNHSRLRKMGDRRSSSKSSSDEYNDDDEMKDSDDDDDNYNKKNRSRGRSRSRSRSVIRRNSSSRSISPSRSRSQSASPIVSEAEEGDESEHSSSEPENGIDIQSDQSDSDNKSDHDDDDEYEDDEIEKD